ncbi:hypothetical protein D3C81_2065750 [compost metagenome]
MRLGLRRLLRLALDDRGALENQRRIDPKEIRGRQRDDDGADTDGLAADGEASAAKSAATAVFHILAFGFVVETHEGSVIS